MDSRKRNGNPLRLRRFVSLLLAVGSLLGGQEAFAVTLPVFQGTFQQITSNGNTNVGSQLTLKAEQSGGKALFTIANIGPTASFVRNVYFDWTAPSLSPMSVGADSGVGVKFNAGGSPGNLPAGNAVGFSADQAFSANSAGTGKEGIDPGEWATFTGTLGAGGFQAVFDALTAGSLRVGLHVQGIAPQGGSESYVNWAGAGGDPALLALPLPAAAWLFGSAMLGFAAATKRRRGD